MTNDGGVESPRPVRDRDSDDDELVAATAPPPEDANGSGDEARSISSDDNDNARVREKLKQTTIAAQTPAGRVKNGAEDEEMSSDAEIRKRRKRSFDDSDPDDKEGREATRVRAHERKKSREMSDEDLANMKAGRALDRVTTPPSVDEEMVSESVDQKVAGATDNKIERKRSRGKIDEGEVVASDKKKITKTEEEERNVEVGSESVKVGIKAQENGKTTDEDKGTSHVTKIPAGSGFANTSAQSPFAAAGAGAKPLFGAGATTNIFATSKLGASPFGTLGAKSSSQSPFGALGASSSTSIFGGGGSNLSGFGSPAKKSAAIKPFGAPDSDGEKSDDEDNGNKSEESEESPEKGKKDEEAKAHDGFVEQEVMTGEEHESTLFKSMARAFAFDKETNQWKERGRGVVKLNKTNPNDDCDPPRKKGARLIMRTEGTLTVVLNIAIYKGMNVGNIQGGPPTGTTTYFVGQEDGNPQQFSLRFKNNTIAKDLHNHVTDLQKELFT